jgi:phage-related protein
MTKAEILKELLKLPASEREEILLKLVELNGSDWLDHNDPLSDEEKAILEARLADMEQKPERSIAWVDAKRQIEERFGK